MSDEKVEVSSEDVKPIVSEDQVEEELMFLSPECPVRKITVYADRAEVCRIINAKPKKGINEIILKNLPACIDGDSIRVEGKGEATIEEVSYQVKYIPKDQADLNEKQKELKALEVELKKEKEDLASVLSLVKQQWEVLNNFAKSATAGIPLQESDRMETILNESYFAGITKFLSLYKSEGSILEDSRITLERKIEDVNNRIAANHKNIGQIFNRTAEEESRECTIVIDAKTEVPVELDVSYVVTDASWVPSYDIRMFTSEGVMKIMYYGQIQQSTGEDWNDAKIFLSTASPSIGGTVPDLESVVLSLRDKYRPVAKGFSLFSAKKVAAPRPVLRSQFDEYDPTVEDAYFSSAPMMDFSVAQHVFCIRGGSPKVLGRSRKLKSKSSAIYGDEEDENMYELLCKNVQMSVVQPVMCLSVTQLINVKIVMDLFFPALCWCNDLGKVKLQVFPVMYSNSFSNQNRLMSCVPPPPPPPAAACMTMARTKVAETTTSTSYEIARISTIPSDSIQHKVSVGIIDLKPRLEYITVPKKVPRAFLTAKLTNTSQFTLLPGPTSIFLDNSFVAKADLKSVSPQEEFECSLGVDPSVRVIYKPLKKFQETTGFISKQRSMMHQQDIEVKNTHEYAIKILIKDNLPQTGVDKIKVNLLEPAIDLKHPEKNKDTRLNTKQNHIEWDLDVGKQETKTVTLKYSLEYPANEEIDHTERMFEN
ncbi:hypothetical protein LOTGIDRAFT_230318 [Lottia gigantea]|uniref:DUF4139 domain-containing protein n=1 Tax=Lottia gigantea TaxID=225164 RepID=V4BE81_LOTGI|nr:hypothetical protein LOTGIDRAFT_230318 [Lottia gigantea]ESP04072.1 hypothetical protein LOTGIDRAFT_230318 [Lottia gigantea]